MANYYYSEKGDFSNGVNLTCLNNSIRLSSISDGFNGINKTDDTLKIMYQSDLTQQGEEELDLIVSVHDPDNCAEDVPDIGEIIGAGGDAYSNSLSSTSSKTPVKKLRMNITDLPKGRYRIGWYYEWAQSSNKSDFRAHVELNETDQLMYHSQEAQEAGTDQSIPVCGFSYMDLETGNHTIDINYWAEANTSYIQNAKLEIWRVV